MKRLLSVLVLIIGLAFGAKATVLFPHFVDIAPNYEDGNTRELMAAGVDCTMYHSTTPGFMASNFDEAEAFFKDTLPSDVTRTERKIGDAVLVIYTSTNTPDDNIDNDDLISTIYILKRADNSFAAAYCEQRVGQ